MVFECGYESHIYASVSINTPVPGDRCALCKRERSNLVSKYEKIRASIDEWYDRLNGPRLGLCVGFWTPNEYPHFFDIILPRKSPVTYLGVPLRIISEQTFFHEDSSSDFSCPTRSVMHMPDLFNLESNCLLDFIDDIPYDPLYLMYCAKNTAEVIQSQWICNYQSDPIVFNISRIVLPEKDHRTQPSTPVASQKLQYRGKFAHTKRFDNLKHYENPYTRSVQTKCQHAASFAKC